MLVFCDEAWKDNQEGKKVGTLAAIAIPRLDYNAIEDRVFVLAEKYFGFDNARTRETKGKQILNAYEYQRELAGAVSMKLAFGRELLEEIRARQFKVFASVVYREGEVDLLCDDAELLDRPYKYLLERLNDYLIELGPERVASVTFDDRGIKLNDRVAKAYRNFLCRSREGRSYSGLLRTPSFAYSANCVGIQLADLVCTVVNRNFVERRKSPKIPLFYSIIQACEWSAARPDENGYVRTGIKVIGDRR
jgi:hypothetical protein